MHKSALSLCDSPALGFKDSFAFCIFDVATLLSLPNIADLFLDSLAAVLALRHRETGVTDWVGRPDHLTALTPPLPPATTITIITTATAFTVLGSILYWKLRSD